MTIATPGLVLHTTPYGDSSVIAKIFTLQLGVKSYIIKGVRSPKSKIKQNLLQPLTCIDIIVYNNPHTQLNHIKELTPRTIPPNPTPIGNALRMFMAEILYKAINEAEPMPSLWNYIADETANADTPTPTQAEQPIRFLLALTTHLGITPLNNHSTSLPYFDLQQGCYVQQATDTTLPASLSHLLHLLLTDASAPSPQNLLTPQTRPQILQALLAYLQLHLPSFGKINSHQILHTILNE